MSKIVRITASVVFAAIVLATATSPQAQTSLVLEETSRWGSSNDTEVSSGGVVGYTNHLYLAAVSTRPSTSVSSVSGLGLTWTLAISQCSGDATNPSGVEVWWALGIPNTSSDEVTATLSSAPSNAVIAVSRYSGVDVDDPIGSVLSGNSNGQSGACSGGSATSSYSFSLTTEAAKSIVYAAVAECNRTHTPGSGYAEHVDYILGKNTAAAGIAVEDKTIATASTVTVNGTLSGTANWAVAALEIRASSHPVLYFTAADVPALRAGWAPAGVRHDIHTALASAGSSWVNDTPTDPGADTTSMSSDWNYWLHSTKMATMAFLYILNPTSTNYRDKALEYADKLVEVDGTHGSGGWGGTCPGQQAYDIRDMGLSYSIQLFATVFDWLYDFVPAQAPYGHPYRSKGQYAAALGRECGHMRAAMDGGYSSDWLNWWPNSWMQNHATRAYTSYAIATWCLRADSLATASDDSFATDALARMHAVWNTLTPDGVWHEGYFYQAYSMLDWMNAFHVQQTVKGTNGWPQTYLEHFADWMASNILDSTSRSWLVKNDDLAENDTPVKSNNTISEIGSSPISLAHICAAKATTNQAAFMWAASQFAQQDARAGNEYTALPYILEYLLYNGGISPVTPTEKRYSFSDSHVYVWTEGHTSSDYKVASVGGGWAGDAAIDAFPGYPWKSSHPQGEHMNTAHSHEDAGQYYFRHGHTELTTEYGSSLDGADETEDPSPWHNVLLIDPDYGNVTPDSLPGTANPKECGQYDPYCYDGGETAQTFEDTQATTPHDRWLGPTADSIRADYVVHDLSPRYQAPANDSLGPPEGKILSRYDRRILWLRNSIGLGPILFVHDEVEGNESHTFEWRHHSAVPANGLVAASNSPATLPFWRLDCADGTSLALAIGVPTDSSQGGSFTISAHTHKPIDVDDVRPPQFVRVTNTVPTGDTHMAFMMFPVSTSSWSGPTGYPPGVTSAASPIQNDPADVVFNWGTSGYSHTMTFMDDGVDSSAALAVGGVAHVSAGFVSRRTSNGTAAEAYLFWGREAADLVNGRYFISLSDAEKSADVMTRTVGSRLDVYVVEHNQVDLEALLDQALFFEHDSSQTYVQSVYVNGVNIDTEQPQRFSWAHELVGGKSHIRLTDYSSPKPTADRAGRVWRTALDVPVASSPGGAIQFRYTVGTANTPVRLEVYDVRGRRLKVLEEGMREPGAYSAVWKRDTQNNSAVPRGVYMVRLVAGKTTATRKLVLWAR